MILLEQGAPLLDPAIDPAIDPGIDPGIHPAIHPAKYLLDPAAGFDRFGVTLVPGGAAIDR
jgi:hypothetical protein